MKNKEIFIAKLEKAGYTKHRMYSVENDFDTILEQCEKDREEVFKAMYGDKIIKDRGVRNVKEWEYRFGEALQDLRLNYIKSTMHYLIMQIHIKAITI